MFDGKAYGKIDDMPADVRQKYSAAMKNIDNDQNGVPDFLEGEALSTPSVRAAEADSFDGQPILPWAPATSQPPVVSSDSSTSKALVVAGLTILLLAMIILGLVLYIFQH